MTQLLPLPEAQRIARSFADALGSEFVAFLEQECRFDLLEAQWAVRACRDQDQLVREAEAAVSPSRATAAPDSD